MVLRPRVRFKEAMKKRPEHGAERSVYSIYRSFNMIFAANKSIDSIATAYPYCPTQNKAHVIVIIHWRK